MPISVVCPGCTTRFSVSEKFAGKQGPCPKCKKLIKVPEAPPPEEAVTIHAPEEYASAGKDVKGRPISKPLARKETKLSLVPAIAIGGGVLVSLLAAWALKAPPGEQIPMRALFLALISPPITVAGYSFLREQELEPHRGRSLWIRALICGLCYALLWGAFSMVPPEMKSEVWNWVFLAPPFLLVGAGIGFACFDLEIGNGAFLYLFYVITTGLLGWLNGLPVLGESPVT